MVNYLLRLKGEKRKRENNREEDDHVLKKEIKYFVGPPMGFHAPSPYPPQAPGAYPPPQPSPSMSFPTPQPYNAEYQPHHNQHTGQPFAAATNAHPQQSPYPPASGGYPPAQGGYPPPHQGYPPYPTH